MFVDVKEAIKYIESKFVPKSVADYQKILVDHHIALNTKNIIHVTGTNGKGSTIHYLSQFLIKAGKNVGTFTSPYLISYHDRFCVNGKPIDDCTLLQIVNQNYDFIEEAHLSKFEIDILIMIEYFNSLPLDYAIIEVGIGGKEDKTNVINSNLSVIVNIGKDHLPRLGKDIYDITAHKIGIIKENHQVFTGVKQEKCLEMIQQKVKETHSTLHIVHEIVPFAYGNLPPYQYENISLAYAIFQALKVDLSFEKMQEVINDTNWKGRFERFVYHNSEIIIDGAHNEDGIQALITALQQTKKDYKIIFSALRDKDYPSMIRLLQEYYEVYVTIFEDERKMLLSDLEGYEHVYSCLEDALNALSKEENIVITGSLHFISYVRDYLINHGA